MFGKKKKVKIGISQSQLMVRRFFKHKLALFSIGILIFFYILAFFPGFVSPYGANERFSKFLYAKPASIHFVDAEGKFSVRPFIYGKKVTMDPVTWEKIFKPDTSKKDYIKLFVKGTEYKIFGIWKCSIHLFGTGNPDNPIFIFGSDKLGRDLLSRIIFGSTISLTIGLISVFLSLFIGVILGSFAGLLGGVVDSAIMRFIDILMCIPTIPLWMALSAALPPYWSVVKVYFGMTVILSLIGWMGIARGIRGKFLSLRNEDYVLAAKTFNAGNCWVIRKHLVPTFASYLIVQLSLGIPGMILSETALSFLGLGIRPPAVSWGTLLQDAQNIKALSMNPWLMIPGICVMIVVLAFNFIGDGLRDAIDPYTK